MEDIRSFYDDLASDYHLVYADWQESVRRQGEALARIVGARLWPGPMRILDCSCGIGTQVIGLARAGHDVFGTDVSANAIERARVEIDNAGVRAELAVCDVRALSDAVPYGFDVVMSCDNSLPHLLSEADLRAGLRSMAGRLRPDGLILVTIRDYDEILRERPRVTMPAVNGSAGARRTVFQIWEWRADGRTYDFEHVMGREDDSGWAFKVRRGTYRAVLRSELTGLLEEEGLESVEWSMPADSGFFQPVVTGFKRQRS